MANVNPYAAQAASKPVARIDPVAPFFQVKGWLKLIGWFNIIMGTLMCLTIVYAIVGWLPIWIGVLCNKAASSLESGYQNRNAAELQQATSSIATIIKIVGVVSIIYMVMIAMTIILLLIMLIGGGLASMGSV